MLERLREIRLALFPSLMAAFPAVRILLLPVYRGIRAVPCKKSIIFLGRRHEETAHPRRRGNGRGEKRRLPGAVAAAYAGRLAGRRLVLMNPFVVSEENKRMVLSNITHLLRAYLNNSSCRYVLFC